MLYRSSPQPVWEVTAAGSAHHVCATGRNVPDHTVRGTELHRVITDHLGSVRLVVNAFTGVIAQRMDYDAFGKMVLDEAHP